MSDIKSSKRFILLGGLLFLILAAAARVCGILYTVFATDILYMDTAVPTVFIYLRLILVSVLFGCGISLMVSAMYIHGEKTSAVTVLLYTCIQILYHGSALLIDVCSGAVSGSSVSLAVLANFEKAFFSIICMWGGYWISRYCVKRGCRLLKAVLLSVLLYFGVQIVLQIVYDFNFLVSVAFAPYASELLLMAREYLLLFLTDGCVPLAVSVGVLFLLHRKGKVAF